MKLSILMPVYNEEKTVETVVKSIYSSLNGIKKEIIIVDDNSKDNTFKILDKLKNKYKEIKLFRHEINKGKGGSVRTAIKEITGDLVIIQDSDLEYNPREIKDLIRFKEKSGASVVYGSRALNKKNKHSYLSYYLGNVFLNILTNLLYGSKITDMETCYKLIPRNIIKSLDLKSNGFDMEPEITAKILRKGYSIKETSISYNPRSKEEGKKIKWKDGIIALWALVYWRFKKINQP